MMQIGLTSFSVTLEAEHDLWCAIPPSCNILGHITSVLFRILRETSGEAEIANLQLAIGIDEQIAWLEISVQHVCRMNVLQSTENLINERLEVGVGQRLA